MCSTSYSLDTKRAAKLIRGNVISLYVSMQILTKTWYGRLVFSGVIGFFRIHLGSPVEAAVFYLEQTFTLS